MARPLTPEQVARKVINDLLMAVRNKHSYEAILFALQQEIRAKFYEFNRDIEAEMQEEFEMEQEIK